VRCHHTLGRRAAPPRRRAVARPARHGIGPGVPWALGRGAQGPRVQGPEPADVSRLRRRYTAAILHRSMRRRPGRAVSWAGLQLGHCTVYSVHTALRRTGQSQGHGINVFWETKPIARLPPTFQRPPSRHKSHIWAAEQFPGSILGQSRSCASKHAYALCNA
jgi:hypothetical protein